MMTSVRARLYLMAGVAVVMFALILGGTIFAMGKLAGFQDEGFRRTQDQSAAAEAAHLGEQFYQIVADAIINRDLAAAKRDFEAMKAEADRDLKALAVAADTDAEKAAVIEAQKAVARYAKVFEAQLLPLLQDAQVLPEAVTRIDGEVDAISDEISKQLALVEASMADEAVAADKAFDEMRSHTITMSLLIGAGALVLIGLVCAWLVRSILVPLAQVQEATRRVAEGDLTRPVETRGHDEFAQLLKDCAAMQASLRDMVRSIQQGATDITDTSARLASATSQIATATEEQTQATSGMAASVEEMSVSINHVADRANDVRSAAGESGRLSGEGRAVMERLQAGSQAASTAVESSAARISELEGLSTQISTVVNVIRDVADQTNLLALNAAIEAARAGEQGRGFAVVADEVRKLAERTAKSTREITEMIVRIQQVTADAVASMGTSVDMVHEGATFSEQATAAIVQIESQVSAVITAVDEISTALTEQSTASMDIARRVERVAQMNDENSSAVGANAELAAHLSRLAGSLQQQATRFRL